MFITDGGMETTLIFKQGLDLPHFAAFVLLDDPLDKGDPAELADRYRELRQRLPNLSVVGGCCGTDHRHVEAVCAAVTA